MTVDGLHHGDWAYRALFEHAPDAIVIVDDDGRVVDVNHRAAAMFGPDPRDVVGRHVAVLMPLDVALLDPMHAEHEGEVTVIDLRVGSDRGDERWLELRASHLPGGSGDLSVVVVTDVTDQRRREAELEHQAMHDSLTGLANRTELLEHLQRITARVQRDGLLVGIAYVDVDLFKEINDAHGHTVGDAVLRTVARRLESAVRSSDVVARVGGDEFVVLVTTDTADVRLARTHLHTSAERMRRACAKPVDELPGDRLVTISVGLTIIGGEDDERDPTALLRRADRALYAAKGRGRNRIGGWWELDATARVAHLLGEG